MDNRLLNNSLATDIATMRQTYVRKALQCGVTELRDHAIIQQERGVLGGLLYWQKIHGIS